jgi:hypothetical protein
VRSGELAATSSSSQLVGESTSGVEADGEELPHGGYDRRIGYYGGTWRPCGFERVDPFALLLGHIGPPIVVTAEHVRLHILGTSLPGVTPVPPEWLQPLYQPESQSLGTN